MAARRRRRRLSASSNHEKTVSAPGSHDRIYAVVARIPRGRVATYARGRISLRSDDGPAPILQRLRLEREKVVFDAEGRIRLERYRWHPRGRIEN